MLVTGGLYALLGRPDLAPQPLAERSAEIKSAQSQQTAEHESLTAALKDAQAQAQANPTSVESQLRLAMTAAEAEASEIELSALDRALTLTQGSPAIKAIKAEALSRKAGGLVTIPARNLIAEVLAESPEDPRALYLLALPLIRMKITSPRLTAGHICNLSLRPPHQLRHALLKILLMLPIVLASPCLKTLTFCHGRRHVTRRSRGHDQQHGRKP